MKTWLYVLPALFATASAAWSATAAEWPLLLREDFEQGADRWQPTDPTGWRIELDGQKSVYSQFEKKSKYQPPHRSPFNFALLKELVVGDFELTARVKSTHADYGHRDVCVIFCYQNPARYYYTHISKQADDHAHQVFIVNDAPRTKISRSTTSGVAWTDGWHTVRVVRKTADGSIAVYFDDLTKPIMTAVDNTFTWGQIGVGTFDDTSQWDVVELRGVKVEPASTTQGSAPAPPRD